MFTSEAVKLRIPRSRFQFGQRVIVRWQEVELGETKAVITGVNFDHRRDREPQYTITDEDGGQTDGLTDSMLTAL